MLSSAAPDENHAATRAALIGHLAAHLAPLLGRGDKVTACLREWTAHLTCAAILRAIKDSPAGTAEALALALMSDTGRRNPNDAIGDIVAIEYARRSHAQRAAIAALATAVQRIARENDGVVEERHLVAANFRVAEATNLMPEALRVLAILERGDTHRQVGPSLSPVERLIEAGMRSADHRAEAA